VKVVFKASQYGFHSEWNDSGVAKEILKQAPCTSVVSRQENTINFPLGIDTSAGDTTTNVRAGDIVYRPQDKSLSILLSLPHMSPGSYMTLDVPAVVVGHTHASTDELRQIKDGENVRLEIHMEEKKQQKPVTDSRRYGSGILSQSQIDAIVSELLSGDKNS
jgi:hypothetical protein